MELQDYLRVLRAHWKGVLALTLAGLVVAIAYNFTQPKIYAANASGFVSTGTSTNAAVGSVGDSLAKSRAASYVELAKGRKVAQIVIDKLGLNTTPDALIGQITVVQPPDTVTLQITARATTPAAAQQLADAWVQALSQGVEDIENPNREQGVDTIKVLPVEAAALPSAPVSPRTRFNMLIGLVAGFVFGMGYALIRNLLDRRLRDAEQVERMFQISVVGGVPDDKYFAHEDGERGPLAVLDGGSGSGRIVAESFRKMRTNLSYMDVDNPPRLIVVTSPRPNDGKSTVAANLAAAVAASGSPTLLLDGDLRRPTVTSYMGVVAGSGLTDVLVGSAEPDDVMQDAARIPQLKIMGAGQVPPNPSELLGSQAMRHLLLRLAEEYIVIIDAPPLLPVTDAAILTRHADGALIVIRAGKTPDNELATALGNLSAVNARTLGVVLNRLRKNSNNNYLYDSYYGEELQPKRSSRASKSPKPVRVSGGKRSK
ncbi:MAG TPA: polysaccharide biosynthesis tyrosine autokinase [Marmoricola sp.]|nr:polysaccharide biosynthesis tyrosine autokinase [Marmoricola sp.]